MKGLCFFGAILLSYLINTYYFDNIFTLFNVSTLTFLLNRVCLALLIYTILDGIFIEKRLCKTKLIIIYFLWLFGILFGRKGEIKQTRFNFISYLPYWFNHLDNKLVFYNLFGNILIFIPLGMIINNFFRCFLFIILIEFLQAITNLGYFDIDDILLNSIGVVIGIILRCRYPKNTVKDL